MTTVGTSDYFIVFGALLAIYGILRVLFWVDVDLDIDVDLDVPQPQERPPDALSKYSDIESHTIDTSALTHRLDNVRRDYASHAHSPSPAKPVLVEERRKEIAKNGYFQKPPHTPEPPEHEAGLPGDESGVEIFM